MYSAEEEAAWKARAAPVEEQMKALRKSMRGKKGEELDQLEKKLEDVQDQLPEPLPTLFAVADDPAKATPIHVLARGDYQNKGDRVGMRPLGVLLPDGAPELSQAEAPRAALARWVVDPENPLTARVMVNRLWHGHFGRGIVATPNDFGTMGPRPTHPELLDWLANEFVDGGFRIKRMHRLILLSDAYQQSAYGPQAARGGEKDPENKLLWHFSRRRLEAEEIRDAMLAVSGRLNRKAGGLSIIVPV